MRTLLSNIQLNGLFPLGQAQATPKQLEEIKAVEDKAAREAGAKTQKEKYEAVFRWTRRDVIQTSRVTNQCHGGSSRRAYSRHWFISTPFPAAVREVPRAYPCA